MRRKEGRVKICNWEKPTFFYLFLVRKSNRRLSPRGLLLLCAFVFHSCLCLYCLPPLCAIPGVAISLSSPHFPAFFLNYIFFPALLELETWYNSLLRFLIEIVPQWQFSYPNMAFRQLWLIHQLDIVFKWISQTPCRTWSQTRLLRQLMSYLVENIYVTSSQKYIICSLFFSALKTEKIDAIKQEEAPIIPVVTQPY